MTTLTVATLNLRNLADRWWERAPLVFSDMAALQPDILGLQEVVYPLQQDRLVGAAGAGSYTALRGWAGRPEYGNAVLVREPLGAARPTRLDLDHSRSALRVRIAADGAPALTFVVTHLHHTVPDEAIRAAQAEALVAWLADLAEPAPVVVVGDFNAEPVEPAYAAMTRGGFRSAHRLANGEEPAVTWPSGIQAPGMDTDGDPGCLDYIWVRGAIEVHSCRLAFDRPAVDDPTLYPSDHLGLVATIQLG
ncbi:MAG TPA: endonuclease/exonuclease/phosphatase family protein [Candidatus Limnocylindrales bacterium]|nr:endonuclease/exonuclease/phosphatase family protein [Candidatus Limnocylindrales bacterium]